MKNIKRFKEFNSINEEISKNLIISSFISILSLMPKTSISSSSIKYLKENPQKIENTKIDSVRSRIINSLDLMLEECDRIQSETSQFGPGFITDIRRCIINIRSAAYSNELDADYFSKIRETNSFLNKYVDKIRGGDSYKSKEDRNHHNKKIDEFSSMLSELVYSFENGKPIPEERIIEIEKSINLIIGEYKFDTPLGDKLILLGLIIFAIFLLLSPFISKGAPRTPPSI